jgi:hypothetical protein
LSLQLTKLRELTLKAGPGPRFLSAASGLVRSGSELYVVADDELHLGRFPAQGAAAGQLLRLFDGHLPRRLEKRKKRKPDLEILLKLPAWGAHPLGCLLALGSGSGKRRRRGALLPLDRRGHVVGTLVEIDATPLFEKLATYFDDLNLEGAWVHGKLLHLLQRGNKGNSPNAVVSVDLLAALKGLGNAVLPRLPIDGINQIDLGEVAGVPLGFTDASVLGDGRWLFSAVAEDTGDAQSDGPCVAASIGMADAANRVLWIKQVQPLYKIEGIEARQRSSGIELLMVTDADSPAVPARVLSATVQAT